MITITASYELVIKDSDSDRICDSVDASYLFYQYNPEQHEEK